MATSARTASGQFVAGTHWRPRKPHWDRAWLSCEYETRQRSAADIAAEVGVGDSAIHFWLKKHGIAARTVSEARAIKHWGVSGPANPMYGKRGAECPAYVAGTSPERAALRSRAEGRAFRMGVLRRDGFLCQRCRVVKHGRRTPLHVHHVRPWAKHIELRYAIANGVALCKACHHWVHSKRNTASLWVEHG